MTDLEKYFEKFRKNIIGYDQLFQTPYGEKKVVYADWTASGRLYKPIERKICETFGPFVGNTHSESSVTGTCMTKAYHLAHERIKRHVNAKPSDVILTTGFGMTATVNKFQRILGIKVPEQLAHFVQLKENDRPVVFITHMEHHSNQTSWLETLAEVVCIEPDRDGFVDFNHFQTLLDKYKNRKFKIGSFTACSNVSGIQPPIHKLAKMMHENGGYCFIDYAASAPYVKIDMHPGDPMEKLDAIFFSPHKFLGGPGTSGVLIFDSALYHNRVPDHPGGGTVNWTNPWGSHSYISDIEAREDGGTPGFLQAIKSALCIQLKEEMTPNKMLAREKELLKIAFAGLRKIPGLTLLADNCEDRLGILSFYIDGIHYNLLVKMLNDRFGIQVRGGCFCAGTYGHLLLHVDYNRSKRITDLIDEGDLSAKPGWVRMSIHPTSTNDEVYYIIDAIDQCARNHDKWEKEYRYSSQLNEYQCILGEDIQVQKVETWFEL